MATAVCGGLPLCDMNLIAALKLPLQQNTPLFLKKG